MGQGGKITLVNGTTYDWNRTGQDSYQMNAWSFPEIIKAGTTATVYIEWNQDIFKHTSDDSGNAYYTLGQVSPGSLPPYMFKVQARANDGFNLSIFFQNISTSSNTLGSTLDLKWIHDGCVQFTLAESLGKFVGGYLPVSWMQGNIDVLGNRTLRQICIPGSHDSGMSQMNGSTKFGTSGNTLTQRVGIHGQLLAGARYFDIRPVISGGVYFTGHYSMITVDQQTQLKAAIAAGTVLGSLAGAALGYLVGKSVSALIGDVDTWQGANGQSIDSIIDDINSFTSSYNELVILNFSHDYNTDVGNDHYTMFTQDEWNELFRILSRINNLYVAPSGTTDLTTLRLSSYIGNEKPAVVLVIDPSDRNITLGNYKGKGFYPSADFPVYNEYAGTNDLNKMSIDQLTKMKEKKTSPESIYFLLSWTLTQGDLESVLCFLQGYNTVLQLSEIANPSLYERVLPVCTQNCFPNILYIDAVFNPGIAALAMAINCVAASSAVAGPEPQTVTASSFSEPWVPANVTNRAPGTYWMSAANSKDPQWIELRYNKSNKFNHVSIAIKDGHQGSNPRIQSYNWDSKIWTTLSSFNISEYPRDAQGNRLVELNFYSPNNTSLYRYYSEPTDYVMLNYLAFGQK